MDFDVTDQLLTMYTVFVKYLRKIGMQWGQFLPHGATAPSGTGLPHYRGFTITLRHTTLGRTPLDD